MLRAFLGLHGAWTRNLLAKPTKFVRIRTPAVRTPHFVTKLAYSLRKACPLNGKSSGFGDMLRLGCQACRRRQSPYVYSSLIVLSPGVRVLAPDLSMHRNRSDLGQGPECFLAVLKFINPTFQSSKHLILDIGSSCVEIGMMERLQHLVQSD